MQVPIPIRVDRRDPSHLHVQIIEQIRKLILDGSLQAGTQLPSSRLLAEQLRVSRNTVLLAYDRLAIEGYTSTSKRSKTTVSVELAHRELRPSQLTHQQGAELSVRRTSVLFRGEAPQLTRAGPKPLIDFFVGRPSPHAFPTKTWRRLLLARLSSAGTALNEYRDPAGMIELRQAIAEHLGPARGMNVKASQVIVVNGIQEALNIVCRLFIQVGAPVAVENPCYQGAAFTFDSYGADLIPVLVDRDGLIPELLPERSVSVLYVTPSHQFPTGAMLTLERRLRILEWARRVGAYIVEDDYDSDFRYDGPPLTALAGLDTQDAVIYLGTFSKSIGPGLRIGYLVLPTELVAPATTIKAILNAGHSWLDQAILSDFIGSGGFARHLRQIRAVYSARRDCLLDALRCNFGTVDVTGDRGGMHIMWHVPNSFPTAIEIEARARAKSVGVYSLRAGVACEFGKTPYGTRSLILGYASLSERQIRDGIGRIAGSL